MGCFRAEPHGLRGNESAKTPGNQIVSMTEEQGEVRKESESLPLLAGAEKDLFDTTAATVLVKKVQCPIDGKLREAIGQGASEHFTADIDRHCAQIQEVLCVIQLYIDQKEGWFPMKDDTWYSSKVDAVVPKSRRGAYSQWPSQSDISAPFGAGNKYIGTPPTKEELCRIVNSTGPNFSNGTHDYYWVCWNNLSSISSCRCNYGVKYNSLPEIPSSLMLFANSLYDSFAMDSYTSSSYGEVYRIHDGTWNNGTWHYPSFTAYYVPLFRFHHQALTEPLTALQVLAVWCLFDLEPDIYDYVAIEERKKQPVPPTAEEEATAVEEQKTAWQGAFAEIKEWFAAQPELFDPQCETLLNPERCQEAFMAGKSVLGLSYDGLIEQELAKQSDISLDEIRAHAQERLLKGDEWRANLRPAYGETMLTTADNGHWDLWAENAIMPNCKALTIPCRFYARNPKSDIRHGAVVGIDFGTKSTVVVRLRDGEDMAPMRIGLGDLRELPKSSRDYENPTIMQFRDWRSFQAAYEQREGRPETLWEDLTVSHTAFDERKGCEDGPAFNTFFAELKQWAGKGGVERPSGGRSLERNLPGERHLDDVVSLELRSEGALGLGGGGLTVKPFLSIDEGDANPLEIYAYHLGLQINNMMQGIYLRYELSYPVTYRKENLEKLRASFERGIRKSLPQSLLNDDEVMADFYVRFGASEPAAYALCALQEYGFCPEEDELVHFGVFDFGGGTTDFDFGVFRGASEASGKDYVLTHFRADGDQYLGGENILQLMAFQVFRANAEALLKARIQFCHPYEEEDTDFDGAEALLNDTSAEAHLNMQRLMEKLRVVWEGGEAGEVIQDGMLSLNLRKTDGTQVCDQQLKVDVPALKELIRRRIGRAVDNFFERIRQSFAAPNISSAVEVIHILPAGNSCRSPVVTELFLERMESFDCGGNELLRGVRFELLPLLGTEEGDAWIAEHNELADEAYLSEANRARRPSGKTGVAFGLVMGRDGGEVQVIDGNRDESGEIGFLYHVGHRRKGLFRPVLSDQTETKAWQPVKTVGVDSRVELLVTQRSEAVTGKMPAKYATCLPLPVSQPSQRDMTLFVRIAGPDAIDYAIAPDEASIDEAQAKRLTLG